MIENHMVVNGYAPEEAVYASREEEEMYGRAKRAGRWLDSGCRHRSGDDWDCDSPRVTGIEGIDTMLCAEHEILSLHKSLEYYKNDAETLIELLGQIEAIGRMGK